MNLSHVLTAKLARLSPFWSKPVEEGLQISSSKRPLFAVVAVQMLSCSPLKPVIILQSPAWLRVICSWGDGWGQPSHQLLILLQPCWVLAWALSWLLVSMSGNRGALTFTSVAVRQLGFFTCGLEWSKIPRLQSHISSAAIFFFAFPIWCRVSLAPANLQVLKIFPTNLQTVSNGFVSPSLWGRSDLRENHVTYRPIVYPKCPLRLVGFPQSPFTAPPPLPLPPPSRS